MGFNSAFEGLTMRLFGVNVSQFRQTVHFAVQQTRFAMIFRMRLRLSFNSSVKMTALQGTERNRAGLSASLILPFA